MARPESIIEEGRNVATGLLAAMDRFDAWRKRYYALGGAPFIAPHFTNADGTPRTDLDIDSDTVTGVVVSGDAITELLTQGHRTNLSKATR